MPKYLAGPPVGKLSEHKLSAQYVPYTGGHVVSGTASEQCFGECQSTLLLVPFYCGS